MRKRDDFLDDDAATANRSDNRSAIAVTLVAFAAVLLASIFVVFGGIIPTP